jgi:hypothetical protein
MFRIRDVYPGSWSEFFHPGYRIQGQKDSGSRIQDQKDPGSRVKEILAFESGSASEI